MMHSFLQRPDVVRILEGPSSAAAVQPPTPISPSARDRKRTLSIPNVSMPNFNFSDMLKVRTVPCTAFLMLAPPRSAHVCLRERPVLSLQKSLSSLLDRT
jgi:hypothetical protein